MYIMAHFNNQTRISDDQCDLSIRSIQNTSAANYVLDQQYKDCSMKSVIEFATNQPNVNFSGSHQTGIGGCNIEENSVLLHTYPSKPKCRINLQTRQFLTVPYLGKGGGNPVIEQQLLQGESETNRKSVHPYSEICYNNYKNTPLLPSIEATITNPTNLVESEASDGWIRGGLPSRELTRDSQTHST